MRLSLCITDPNYAGTTREHVFAGALEHATDTSRGLVGRDPASCQMVIEEGSASRRHFEVLFSDGTFWIRNLSQTNGTQIVGKKLLLDRSEQIAIESNDRILVGDIELQATILPPDTAPESAAPACNDASRSMPDEPIEPAAPPPLPEPPPLPTPPPAPESSAEVIDQSVRTDAVSNPQEGDVITERDAVSMVTPPPPAPKQAALDVAAPPDPPTSAPIEDAAVDHSAPEDAEGRFDADTDDVEAPTSTRPETNPPAVPTAAASCTLVEDDGIDLIHQDTPLDENGLIAVMPNDPAPDFIFDDTAAAAAAPAGEPAPLIPDDLDLEALLGIEAHPAPKPPSRPKAQPAPDLGKPSSAAPPVRAPVAKPANVAPTHTTHHGMVEVLIAAGIEPERAHALSQNASAEAVGSVLAALVEALASQLQLRNSFRHMFRLSSTEVRLAGNNPLKLAMNGHEILARLFDPQRGFLSGVEAVQEATLELQIHEAAIASSIRTAFDDLIDRIDPAHIEEATAKAGSPLLGGFGGGRDAASWKAYRQWFDHTFGDRHRAFTTIYLQRFGNDYDTNTKKAKSESDKKRPRKKEGRSKT
ncbi:MAG TPA: type VI secretion system-associated FHA domain protein TagH [Chiayiivirga sp.]|nr:type VI secretion system-associated FHA domain protein TagH [Chiayiivirga sp.]